STRGGRRRSRSWSTIASTPARTAASRQRSRDRARTRASELGTSLEARLRLRYLRARRPLEQTPDRPEEQADRATEGRLRQIHHVQAHALGRELAEVEP